MSEELNIDSEKLEKFRVETTVSGYYLLAWQALLSSSVLPKNLEEYLVTFQETDSEVLIYLVRPAKNRVLGGGGGKFIVSKETFSVVGQGLAR